MSENRFDPLKELNTLRQSVGKVIGQSLQTVQSVAGVPTLKVDVYELDDVVVVRTSAIDGIVPDSIEVSMEDSMLTISGETRPEPTPTTASYLLQERRFGAFSRTVEISIPVRSDEAKAKLKDGVLTITLPKI